MLVKLSEDEGDKVSDADAMIEDSTICLSRAAEDNVSIFLKLTEDKGESVTVAYAMLPLKDEERPVDSWKG